MLRRTPYTAKSAVRSVHYPCLRMLISHPERRDAILMIMLLDAHCASHSSNTNLSTDLYFLASPTRSFHNSHCSPFDRSSSVRLDQLGTVEVHLAWAKGGSKMGGADSSDNLAVTMRKRDAMNIGHKMIQNVTRTIKPRYKVARSWMYYILRDPRA